MENTEEQFEEGYVDQRDEDLDRKDSLIAWLAEKTHTSYHRTTPGVPKEWKKCLKPTCVKSREELDRPISS